MIIVDQHPTIPDQVLCSFRYSLYYLNRMRGIPTARYEMNYKAWSVHKMAMLNIESVFKGELFYKTPLWFLMGMPKPDYSGMYQLYPMTLCPLQLPLFPYQDYGSRFMIQTLLRTGYVLNTDDVGLGKSPQAIATMEYMRQHHQVKKTLIVAKKSLKTQWLTDVFRKFLNEECIVIGGTPKARLKQYNIIDTSVTNSMVISYHTLLNDWDAVSKMNFDLVICDEAHLFKNKDGKINAAVKKTIAKVPYKVLLTGTPLAKNPEDAFGIMQCVDPKLFGTFTQFKANHLVEERTSYGIEVIGFKNIDIYRDKLHSIMIRRTEFEVDVELPEVIPIQVFCTQDTTQETISATINEESIDLLNKINALKVRPNLSPQDVQLLGICESKSKGLIASRQAVANDPRLFAMSKSKAIADKYGPSVPANYKSDKTLKILELIEEIVDSGHKAIIFSKFERQARLMAEDIIKTLKIKAVLFTGEENDAQREENISNFKQDPDYSVLVATDAANEGLNLQMAKYVIHMDQPDLPAIKIQRNGRIRRVASSFKHVFSYDFITENSYDVNRLENIKMLSNTIDAFVSLDSAQSEALMDAMK